MAQEVRIDLATRTILRDIRTELREIAAALKAAGVEDKDTDASTDTTVRLIESAAPYDR